MSENFEGWKPIEICIYKTLNQPTYSYLSEHNALNNIQFLKITLNYYYYLFFNAIMLYLINAAFKNFIWSNTQLLINNWTKNHDWS